MADLAKTDFIPGTKYQYVLHGTAMLNLLLAGAFCFFCEAHDARITH